MAATSCSGSSARLCDARPHADAASFLGLTAAGISSISAQGCTEAVPSAWRRAHCVVPSLPVLSPDDTELAPAEACGNASTWPGACSDRSRGSRGSASGVALVPTPQGERRLRLPQRPQRLLCQPEEDAPPSPPVQPSCSDEEWARRLQQQFDLEAAEKAERARFTCPLCLDTASFDDSVEMDCLHRFCSSCFHGYLEVKIREKCITSEELRCPMPNCGCEVTVPQVEGATRGGPLWDRFLATRAELWQPSSRDGEHLCECPMPGCGARFLTAARAPEPTVRCPECRADFCRDCRCQHPGSTCEAHRAWRRENDRAEREFAALMLRERWQHCPRCKAGVERQHGCNFMTCHSSVCRGKVHFCYICGVELQKSEQFTHFPYGIFAKQCQNVDHEAEEVAAKTLPPLGRRQRPEADANWLVQTLEQLTEWAQGGR